MLKILALINGMIKQIVGLIEFLVSTPNTTLDETEAKVRQRMLEIGRQLIEMIVANRGTGFSQRIIKSPSGEKAIFRGYQNRTIATLMGKIGDVLQKFQFFC